MNRAQKLAQLEKLARLKSDIEMRRFSAFRAHMVVAEQQVQTARVSLEQVLAADEPFSLAGARLSNAMAGECSRALQRAESELERMRPGFEKARALASREFGRRQVLGTLRDKELSVNAPQK